MARPRTPKAKAEVVATRSNTHNNPLRHLYGTARWARVRHDVLSSQPLCVMCLSRDMVEPADTVDHIKPHRGDAELFWDRDNLQSLCKRCHDSDKALIERGKTPVYIGVDGYPIA